jgi:mono/diheme cytochrome c family protein
MTTNEIILAVVTAVLVVFSLTVALVVPKRDPEFPGRRGLAVFFAVSAVFVGGVLAAVEAVGEEQEAEAVEISDTSAQETAPPAEPPAGESAPAEPPAGESAPAESTSGETSAPAAPPAAPAGDPVAGKDVFLNVAGCGSCHTLADAGTTGNVGPNLDDAKPPLDLVIDRVTNGKPPMPAFGADGILTETQIQDVAAYVVQATSG